MEERKITRRDFLVSGLAVGLSVVLVDLSAPFAQTAAESPIPNRAGSGSPMEEGRPKKNTGSVLESGQNCMREGSNLLLTLDTQLAVFRED